VCVCVCVDVCVGGCAGAHVCVNTSITVLTGAIDVMLISNFILINANVIPIDI